jgi:hypothetical protein
VEGVITRWDGDLEREVDGKKYAGHWRVDDKGMLIVTCNGERTSAGFRGGIPKPQAEILFGELINKLRKEGAA